MLPGIATLTRLKCVCLAPARWTLLTPTSQLLSPSSWYHSQAGKRLKWGYIPQKRESQPSAGYRTCPPQPAPSCCSRSFPGGARRSPAWWNEKQVPNGKVTVILNKQAPPPAEVTSRLLSTEGCHYSSHFLCSASHKLSLVRLLETTQQLIDPWRKGPGGRGQLKYGPLTAPNAMEKHLPQLLMLWKRICSEEPSAGERATDIEHILSVLHGFFRRKLIPDSTLRHSRTKERKKRKPHKAHLLNEAKDNICFEERLMWEHCY